MRSDHARRTRGFTVMDMIVGMGITAIAMAVAVPQLSTLIQPHRMTAASRALASQFARARMKAIAQNARHRIDFDADAGTYTLEMETAPNTWTPVGGTRQLPEGLSFATVAADPVISAQGMLAADFVATITSQGYIQTISVNVLGNVDVGDLYAEAT